MFRQLPIIETIADAVDELTDVRMTLSGLALANSGMHEPDTIRLISCLLDYCALTTEAASDKFDEAPRDTTRPDRLS